MAPHANDKPPSEGRIGCRIRVRPDNAEEAERLFGQNGCVPIYVDRRKDGEISFWFGKAPDEELYRIFTSIPREFYAVRGIIVGDRYPFSPKIENGS